MTHPHVVSDVTSALRRGHPWNVPIRLIVMSESRPGPGRGRGGHAGVPLPSVAPPRPTGVDRPTTRWIYGRFLPRARSRPTSRHESLRSRDSVAHKCTPFPPHPRMGWIPLMHRLHSRTRAIHGVGGWFALNRRGWRPRPHPSSPHFPIPVGFFDPLITAFTSVTECGKFKGRSLRAPNLKRRTRRTQRGRACTLYPAIPSRGSPSTASPGTGPAGSVATATPTTRTSAANSAEGSSAEPSPRRRGGTRVDPRTAPVGPE